MIGGAFFILDDWERQDPNQSSVNERVRKTAAEDRLIAHSARWAVCMNTGNEEE
jgi:hypothetical protein